VVDTLALGAAQAPRRTQHSIVVGMAIHNESFAQQPAPPRANLLLRDGR
jgi:hypothetical protein